MHGSSPPLIVEEPTPGRRHCSVRLRTGPCYTFGTVARSCDAARVHHGHRTNLDYTLHMCMAAQDEARGTDLRERGRIASSGARTARPLLTSSRRYSRSPPPSEARKPMTNGGAEGAPPVRHAALQRRP